MYRLLTITAKVQAKEGPAFLKAIEMFMSKRRSGGGLRYKDAGVDIDAGNVLVERIKPACKSTSRPGCDSKLGGFGGLFDLSAAGYGGQDTVLVGATDGVGTKLKVSRRLSPAPWPLVFINAYAPETKYSQC